MFDGSVVVIMLCVRPKGPRPDWTVMQLNLCLTLWLSSHHFVLMQPSGPLRVTPCWRMKLSVANGCARYACPTVQGVQPCNSYS
jgi:hypothetical protein